MEETDFRILLSELYRDATDACWAIGYMKAVVDREIVIQKISQSFSGYAMEIANIAVKRSLALYCARAWDHARDANSIPNLSQLLPSSEHLRKEREVWFGNPAGTQVIQNLEAEHSKLLTDLLRVDQSRIGSLRVFRTEWLAHRVFSSSDRKGIEAKGHVAETTIKELVEFAELTVNLVGRFGVVIEGQDSPFSELIERSQRYCLEFWRILPKLSDFEDANVGSSGSTSEFPFPV